jgi:hypothetical protein
MILPGTPVRFTESNLGCVRSSHVVQAGDTGTYVGPGPIEDLCDWHITTVETGDGEEVVCPVHVSMFEVIAGA